MIILQIIFVGAALFIAYLGYLIKYKDRVDLIAGYDKSNQNDKEEMGRRMSRSLFSVSSIFILSSISLSFYADQMFLVILTTLVLLVLVIVYSAVDSGG